MGRLTSFWHDERGVTAIEYALIGVLVSLLIFAGASVIGTNINYKITSAANGLR